MNQLLVSLAGIILFVSSCSIKPVTKFKNITYNPSKQLQLDVYAPRKLKEPAKVLVFVYGGNWIHGKKSLYRFFGKGMARKGIVCAVVNYRLSPKTDISGMANDVAEAVKWLKDNSSTYKADTNHFFISGHSAGGHIAAMLATDNRYFKNLQMNNPIKGTVLIDAFGLDMYSYLMISKNPGDSIYKLTFTTDPANWKKTSPIYYLNDETPPFLMFVGGKTYPVIRQLNADFFMELKKHQPGASIINVKGKRHVPMIFQFYNPRAKPYKPIIEFIKKH